MFGVAKQTVQRTVDQFRVEGILITKPGSGTYVRAPAAANRLARGRYGGHRGYHADLAARYRQQLAGVGREAAPPEVADAFGVRDGTEMLVRRHIVRTDDATVEVGASWFRVKDATGTSLERVEAFGRPLYQEAEEVAGQTVRLRDRHDQRPPAEPRGGRDPADPPGHAGAASVARGLRRDPQADRGVPGDLAGPMTTLTEDYRIPAPTPDPDPGPGLALA